MALSWYTVAARNLFTATYDWVSNNINIWLATNTYTFSAAHSFRSDLTNEVTGTNYTAGGLLLDTKTASSANPTVLTSADEVVAQSAGGFANARKYIIVKITGGAASTDPLICYGAAGADFGNQAGALTLDVPPSFITLTCS
jgi:hypothetical protein